MPQNSSSAPSSVVSETPTLRLLPVARPLRLDELTLEVATLVCNIIKAEGLADHLAGALVGVSRATFEHWRAEDAGFALKLEEARAWFEIGLIRQIKEARKVNGAPDWRAQAWLLKHATAEGFAKPARSAKPASASAQKSADVPKTPAAPSVGMLENTANLPKTPARTGGAAGEKTAFLPETRKAA